MILYKTPSLPGFVFLLFLFSILAVTGCQVRLSFSDKKAQSDYKISSTDKKTSIISSSFNWKFIDSRLRSRRFRLRFELLESEISEAAEYLEMLGNLDGKELGINSRYEEESVQYIQEYWKLIYEKLYLHQYARFDRIIKGFEEIFFKENLQSRDKVLFIISFIQNIQYRRPGGRLDLLTPPEVLALRFGDCDTKALLLHILLEKIGIDCVFYWSYQYKHAMLGIAVTGGGKYKIFRGKKYYFLETTYPGWSPGQLPPEMDNINYWYINILDSDVNKSRPEETYRKMRKIKQAKPAISDSDNI